jgi:hypothetical protein
MPRAVAPSLQPHGRDDPPGSAGLDPCTAAPGPVEGVHPFAGQLWQLIADPLSSAGMRARSLRNRHTDDAELTSALDELIGELDRAFGAVLRAPDLLETDDPAADTPAAEAPVPTSAHPVTPSTFGVEDRQEAT